MLTTISKLVGELIDREYGGKLSVIRIQCTKPIYLVFAACSKTPVVTVKVGTFEELSRLWDNHKLLERLIPRLIPKPIELVLIEKDRWGLVQAGLPGRPWFQLRRKLANARYQSKFLDRSVEVLASFHRSINQAEECVREYSPHDEALCLLDLIERADVGLSREQVIACSHILDNLRSVGRLQCHWQHGDFCVNNLMISDSQMFVIDFDELGNSLLPLLDQISLARSVCNAGKAPGAISLLGALSKLRGSSVYPNFSMEQINALVLANLLYSLNIAVTLKMRGENRIYLLSEVRDFLACPRQYLYRTFN